MGKGTKWMGSLLLALSLTWLGVAAADDDGGDGWGHHAMPMGKPMGGMMGGAPMMGMGPGMAMHNPFTAVWSVGLSPEQRKQVREIHKDWRRAMFKHQERLAELHDELWDVYQDPTPDPKAVGQIYGKIFDLKRQMIEKSVAARNAVWQLLNKRQRAMYQQRYWSWRWQH